MHIKCGTYMIFENTEFEIMKLGNVRIATI